MKPHTDLGLSRRKLLGGMGTIGAAGVLGGTGTMAFFSDREQFANDALVAGELDLKVSWEEHYRDWSEDEADHAHMEDGDLIVDDRQGFMDATLIDQFPDGRIRKKLEEGTADPCEVLADAPDDLERPVIELTDVKPGDTGEVTFDVALCDNPGLVWLTGSPRDADENALTDSERTDPDERADVVELLDEVAVMIWYDADCDNRRSEGEEIVFDGSLRGALRVLGIGTGLPLDGDRASDGIDCYAPTPERHSVGFEWELPVDHGNEVQSDSVTFDLGFYVEQCRHNTAPKAAAALEGSLLAEHTGEAVVFTYEVENTAERTIEVTFLSTNHADSATFRNGEEVWRWSEGRGFLQILETRSFDPGESETYVRTWKDPLEGEVEAVATLRAQNASARARTTVGPAK